MECLIASGHWAMELLQCTASLLGAHGSGTLAMHCMIAPGQRAVEHLHCSAIPHGGSGPCNSRNALPQCLRAVCSGTPVMHYLTAWGQW